MNKRLETIKRRLAEDGLDGLIVGKGTDIRYLTEFTGEAGVAVLLITADANYFITDNRFVNQAEMETEDFEVSAFQRGSGYYQAAGERIAKLGLKKCGLRMDEIYYSDYTDMAGQCPETEFVSAKPYLSDLRKIKTPKELQIIRRACNISERSFYALLDHIKPGMTEIDIANELEYQFRSKGGSGFCFETIVASGPDNGANCHATPSLRKIQEGDFVTIDFGTGYGGYCSDITRTVAIGEPRNPELLHIYNTVKMAKRAGEAVLRPGLPMSELHRAIHAVVEAEGYTIPHGPGHSFGMDIHENPFITATNSYCLEPGVVHTMEPGIYVPGVGGVRIEDDYLITETGTERLTNITDELIVIY